MSRTVCLAANTLYYPKGGGHFWVYLNWALGLKAQGCRVIWLEGLNSKIDFEEQAAYILALKKKLAPFDLETNIALWAWDNSPVDTQLHQCMDVFSAALESDLLLNQHYTMPPEIIHRFKKTALLDIDPGLFQKWVSAGVMNMASHDLYFTIGETVGQPGSLFPDLGLKWLYTPPCVALEEWRIKAAPPNAPFTTVTHWESGYWETENGEAYSNDKRTGFLPYFGLPGIIQTPLELAVLLSDEEQHEKFLLEKLGWKIKDSHAVTSTPQDYRSYIQGSSGEFTCVKPSCIRFQNAWISDRSICYLASGKPVIMQHTGKSRFLPDTSGIFRFKDRNECIKAFEIVNNDYQNQCMIARSLAEEFFDAKKVAGNLLEIALN